MRGFSALWVQTPSKALPLLACWRRTPNRCPFGHCWMRDHHSLRSHAPGRIGGVAGQCLYGDGVTARANEQTEAPWQRKMVLHHDDMLRIMSGNASDSPWCV